MKTEYKFGLGRDRRELSYVHTKEFMRSVVIPAQKIRRGEANGNCKLSDEQIAEIRTDKTHTGPYLAKLYGVTKAHIYRIQKWRSRKELGKGE